MVDIVAYLIKFGSFVSSNRHQHLELMSDAIDPMADLCFVDNYRNIVIPCFLGKYAPENIYNAAEMAIFYKHFPHESLPNNDQICANGELSHERITVMPIVNMAGKMMN